MSKYVLLIALLGASTLIIVGCGVDPEAPDIPTNLQITDVVNDGLGVRLEWDVVAEADGYIVVFEGSVIDSTISNFYLDDDPGDVGEYQVKSYAEEESSPSDAVSTVPVTGGATIYERTAAGNSAFGWAADGTGSTASLNDPYDGWDFYAEDFDTLDTDPLHIHLVSPSYDIKPPPFSTEDTTWISKDPVEYDTLDVAPENGYYSEIGPHDDPSNPTEGLNAGEAYVVDAKVDGNRHYAKVNITTVGAGGNVDFSYAFQTVPGFRRLDTD